MAGSHNGKNEKPFHIVIFVEMAGDFLYTVNTSIEGIEKIVSLRVQAQGSSHK